MGLLSLLDQFFLLSTARDEKTQEHYRRAVRWLGEMLGRSPQLSDLTDDHIRALLAWLQQTRKQSATTANGAHKCLCRLWRWARDRGLVNTGPTVPRLKEPARTPQAWTHDELRRLVDAASTSPGSIAGIPAGLWWRALLALEWDTGCRASELLAIRWEWVEWDRRWIRVPAECRKGGRRDAVYGLMADTIAALEPIRQPQGPILGDVGHRSAYYRLWDDLLARAGLPTGRRRKTQMLRRSFASHLLSGGGDPTAALGHASRATTQASYLDPTLTARPHGEKMPFRLIGGPE
jgi:integrase